jgi:hypothetical protein
MSDTNIVPGSNPGPSEPSSILTPFASATLPIGTPVVFSTTTDDTVGAAEANAIATAFVAGVLSAPSVDGARCTVQTRGPIQLTVAQWNALITGATTGLTRGPYYLSAAAPGKLVVAQPSGDGDVVCLVGYAISATQMVLAQQPTLPVTEGDA